MKEAANLEGGGISPSSASTSKKDRPLCIFCCYPFHPRGTSQVGGEEEEMIKQFGTFLEVVVQFNWEDTEGLFQSVCRDCMKLVGSMVEAKEKAREEEERVRKLQKEILEGMRGLSGSLERFGGDLQWMERNIEQSDVVTLESRVKMGDIPEVVFGLREKVIEVVRDWKVYRTSSEVKFNFDGVNEQEMEEIQEEIPLQSTSTEEEVASGVILNGHETSDTSVEPEASPVPNGGAEEAISEDDEVMILEEEIQEKKEETATAAPATESPQGTRRRGQINSPADLPEAALPPSSPVVTRKRAADAAPPPRRRFNDPKLDDENYRPFVKIALLSASQIESYLTALAAKRAAQTEIIITASGKKIIKRVVSFNPSSGTSDSDDAPCDEDTSSEDHSGRDSLISFITKQVRRVSPWKRKITAGLLGKMKFEKRLHETAGTPLTHEFAYNRKSHSLTFGNVGIRFFDREKNLGCKLCGNGFRTSHNETNLFKEITGHILKTHLDSSGVTNGVIRGGVRRKKGKQEEVPGGDWDPNWDEDEEEAEEEPKETVPVPEKRALPPRNRRAPARFAEDKEETEVPEENKESESEEDEETEPVASKRARRSKVPASPETVTLSDTPMVSAKMKTVLESLNTWNGTVEGKRVLGLMVRKLDCSRARKVCVVNFTSGEIRVLGHPLIYNEAGHRLSCSICHEEVELKGAGEGAGRAILHVVATHSKTFDCGTCGEKTGGLDGLREHEREHKDNSKENEETNGRRKGPRNGKGGKIGRFVEEEKEGMGRRKISFKRGREATRKDPSDEEYSSNDTPSEEDDDILEV